MPNQKFQKNGQALMEYLIVLVMVILLGGRLLRGATVYFADSVGRFNNVLSMHLSVGVCKQDCFTDAYGNGLKF